MEQVNIVHFNKGLLMNGVWDVCPCMDNVFKEMQIGDCTTGVTVSYSISNRFYSMIVGLTTTAFEIEGSVDIDIYSADISVFEETAIWVHGLYNRSMCGMSSCSCSKEGSCIDPSVGNHLSDTDTVRLHSVYFDGSQTDGSSWPWCDKHNTTAVGITAACNQVAVI
eukprot:SAG31_NODE_7298_length_1728_cov_0.893800_1_plen_165_part_10